MGDVAGIAAAITRLAEDPRLRTGLGRRAAAEQRARYTLQTMTDAYLGIYAEATR